jgi:argininosuccinate synthase
MKSRGVTDAGRHRARGVSGGQSLNLDREVVHLRDSLIALRGDGLLRLLVRTRRIMLQAAIDGPRGAVTGTARLRLSRQRRRRTEAARSLYDPKIVSFEEGGGYRQEDAGGFIRLSGLRLRIRALVERRTS